MGGMESVLIAALLAAAPTSPPVETATTALDRMCFGLMAELAGDDDPRARSLGQVAAQYFLGRIDAATPGFDPAAALDDEPPMGAERDALLGRCGDAMQAGGRDFRSIGRALAPRERPGA
jgi:hypothetical protein